MKRSQRVEFRAAHGRLLQLCCLLVCGLSLGACSVDLGSSSQSVVTTLCGYPENSQPEGPSIGTCLGVCTSTVTGGSCDAPDTPGYVTLVYGCPGKTNGTACDGYTNGGVELGRFSDGRPVSFSDYRDAYPEYCTFQIDVGPADPWEAQDFIIWQRDECGETCKASPVANVAASPTLWSPSHEYRRINLLQDCQVTWESQCGSLSGSSTQITCVSSDEPDDALGSGDGHTTEDIRLVDGLNVDLRAERAGGGNGRCYTINFRIVDPFGNTGFGQCTVGVPHDGSGVASCDAEASRVCVAACGGTSPPASGLVLNSAADFHSAVARNTDLRGAIFNFKVTGLALDGLDLGGAHFRQGIENSNLINTKLEGARFDGEIWGRFLGANLKDANFSGATLYRSNFLYADLGGVSFGCAASVDNTSFSFAKLDARTQIPYSIPKCAYAGLPGGPPMLQHVQLNTPAILAALTGSSNRDVQIAKIRSKASDRKLFDALRMLLPAGSFDRQLHSSFRSAVYDQLRENGIYEFPVKSFVFDDVNEYWWNQSLSYHTVRPAGGPTLSWLYYSLPKEQSLQVVIGDVLADAILSDKPIYLDDPIGGRVSSGMFVWNLTPDCTPETKTAYITRMHSLLYEATVDWNGRLRTRADILVPAWLIDRALDNLDPAARARLWAIGADHIVAVQDLVDAGLFSQVMGTAYDTLIGYCPSAPSGQRATAISSTQILVSWQDNSDNEVGFEVNDGVTTKQVGANKTSYLRGGLTSGKSMCFRVRAYSVLGASKWTPYACATTF